MKTTAFAIIALSAVAGLWWGVQRNEAAQLRIERERLQQESADLRRLRQERDRLLRLQPSDAELDRLRREAAERDRALLTPDPLGANVEAGGTSALPPGTWAAAPDWKNRGRATPEAALETMLWAAAGGDIEALKDTLEIDAASRAKMAASLAKAPAAWRQAYATPEDVLALVLAANIPLESVQRAARQQTSDKETTEFIRLKNPAGGTRQVHLTLHGTAEGWKLKVPPSVVDNIAASLPGAARR